MIRTSTKILCDVECRAFVVVAHGVLHVLYGDFAVGLHVEGHRLVGRTLDIGQKLLAAISEHVEVAPHAGLAIAACTKIKRCIGLGEAEVLVHPIEVAFLAGKRNDIRRIHAVFLVVHVELMDTALVGMSRDTIVWHTNSHPHGTTYAGTLAYHLHNPHFIGVGNSERLATAIIAILLHQLGHHLDSLTCRTRTLQAQINQATIVDNTCRVHQLGTPAESGLSNRQLKFVHVAHYIIGLTSLFYLSQVLTRIPLINIDHRSLLVHTCGIMIQLAEQRIGVGRIGNDS